MSPAGGVIIVAITTPGIQHAGSTSRCSLAESSCWKHREEDEGHAKNNYALRLLHFCVKSFDISCWYSAVLIRRRSTSCAVAAATVLSVRGLRLLV